MFTFGESSERELIGVKPQLVTVTREALILSTQDFSVHDGLRTKAEQAKLVAAGASQTMDSKHLTGDAVDLVPYINGKLRWEWAPIYLIAEAVRIAAKKHSVNITWGGAWDVNLTTSTGPVERLVEDYVARRKAMGKKAFIDGPHFELRY